MVDPVLFELPRPAHYTWHPGLIITSREIWQRLSLFAQWKEPRGVTWSAPQQNAFEGARWQPTAPCPSQVVLRTNHSSRYKSYAGGRYVVLLGRENQVLLTSETQQYYDWLAAHRSGVFLSVSGHPRVRCSGLTQLLPPNILLNSMSHDAENKQSCDFPGLSPILAAEAPSPEQSAGCPDDGHQLLPGFFLWTSPSPGFFFICKIAELVP